MGEVKHAAKASRTSGISAGTLSAGGNLLGNEIDNATNKDKFLVGMLSVNCSTAPAADRVIEFFVLYDHAGDGSYERGSGSVDPVRSPSYSVPVAAVTGAQFYPIPEIPISPSKFKPLLKSEINQSATVTLSLWTYNDDLP